MLTVLASVTRFTASSTLPCHCVTRLPPFALTADILAVLSIGFSLAVCATEDSGYVKQKKARPVKMALLTLNCKHH